MTYQFQVGDRVRVRKDLNSMTTYYNYNRTEHNIAAPGMVQLAGEIVTIESCTAGQYKVKEDKEKWFWIDEMFEDRVGTGDWINIEAIEKKAKEERLGADWKEWRETRKRFVWTTRDGESMLISGMKIGHIKNTLALLKRTNTPQEIKDGVPHSIWMEVFEKELQYREMLEQATDRVHEWLNKPQKENKENKENIKMTNTELIEIKENEEEKALDKAKREELKNKFYETPIGKAAKAFNEALSQYGSDEQKANYRIDEDELLDDEAKEYIREIGDKYDAKRTEIRQYYREARSLFQNADTYEQKVAILKEYGILKGPKVKAKVEVK